MANFEGLIRGAIAAKGAVTPDQRQVVYESSRAALKKLIEANRTLTVEAAVYEQRSLEDAINNIEHSFLHEKVDGTDSGKAEPANLTDDDPVSETPDASFDVPESPDDISDMGEAQNLQTEDVIGADESHGTGSLADQFESDLVNQELSEVASYEEETISEAPATEPDRHNNPFSEIEEILGGTVQPREEHPQSFEVEDLSALSPDHASLGSPEIPDIDIVEEQNIPNDKKPQESQDIDVSAEAVPPEFAQRRRTQKNGLWIIAILVLLATIVWIGYRLFAGVVDGSLLGLDNSSQGITRSGTAQDQSSDYITILEPGDLTALVVSDRGRVEIINEQSLEMIRLLSVRDISNRLNQAEPILLRLKPGVIEQIRGKRVTAEVFARSGTSSPAQFAVECRFGENIGCGRKRFRVGVQPEASIFAFTLEQDRDINEPAQIAINTDITDNAAITGEGDVLDIVYVRLRSGR